jgi:hypothetical protein
MELDLAFGPATAPPEKSDPKAAILQIWEGRDDRLLRVLCDCLLEHHIPYRAFEDTSWVHHLLVAPEAADRARGILREILERTLPT